MSPARPGRVALLLLLGTAPANAETPDGPEVEPRLIADAVLQGAEAALEGRAREARKAFERAEAFHPRPDEVRAARGLAELLAGRRRPARRALRDAPRWAVYAAMAEMGRPGGLGRAVGRLAAAGRSKEAPPGVHFLLALAHARAGRVEAADRHLARAAKGSKHALDATWAPDPAVGLAQASLRALEGLIPRDEARVRLAEHLQRAGRRGQVLLWTERAPADDALATRARAARARALADVGPAHAVDAAAAWRRRDRAAVEPRLLEAEHALHKGDAAAAGRALDAIDDAPERLRARVERARARVALARQDVEAAMRAARAAARAEPESALGRAILTDALLAEREIGRAAEIAEDVLRRRPEDVNAYALLVRVRRAQGRDRLVPALELRSQAFSKARSGRERLVAHAEKVFAATRDAEAGLGATGLAALRAEDPRFGLPLDIAVARKGRLGVARAARDRILTACGPRLAKLLGAKGERDRTQVNLTLHGKPRSVAIALSAADPFRCRGPSAGRRGRSR